MEEWKCRWNESAYVGNYNISFFVSKPDLEWTDKTRINTEWSRAPDTSLSERGGVFSMRQSWASKDLNDLIVGDGGNLRTRHRFRSLPHVEQHVNQNLNAALGYIFPNRTRDLQPNEIIYRVDWKNTYKVNFARRNQTNSIRECRTCLELTDGTSKTNQNAFFSLTMYCKH